MSSRSVLAAMLMLLVLIALAGPCAGEPLSAVEALQAAGRARAALCVRGRGRGCGAALWAPRWLLARASCLRGPLPGAKVLINCDVAQCHNFTDAMEPIDVMARFEHPQYSARHPGSQFDAALVLLAAPAARAPDELARARAAAAVPELAAWLTKVPEQFPAARAWPPGAPPARLASWRFASTPLRLLASTVVLPLAALLLLFALALRMSWGQPDDVPYDALERDDENELPESERDNKTAEAGGDAGAMGDFCPTLPAI